MATPFLGVLVIAAAGWILFGRMPGPGGGTSRMDYAIGVGVLSLGGWLAVYALIFAAAYAGIPEHVGILSYVVAALLGVGFGMFALGRSKDAGGGRSFAALVFVPFVQLWVLFASPVQDPTRPPYTPQNGALRFAIGFTVLLLGIMVPRMVDVALGDRGGALSRAALQAEIAGMNAALPQRLDE